MKRTRCFIEFHLSQADKVGEVLALRHGMLDAPVRPRQNTLFGAAPTQDDNTHHNGPPCSVVLGGTDACITAAKNEKASP
jgi:hypothetical protein